MRAELNEYIYYKLKEIRISENIDEDLNYTIIIMIQTMRII